MPPADTISRSTKPPHQLMSGAPPPEPEHLPCPRCDSTSTKFCYYNNYNFSQPRHFCKACRRYWTHGGTLRDIPVGGSSRKNAKRSRPSSASIFSNTSGQENYRHFPAAGTPFFLPLSGGDQSVPFMGDMKQGLNMCGSFTSLLNTQGPAGLLTLGGFGLGIGHHGFEDMGFGLGRASSVWPFSDGGGDNGGGVMGNTWQLESGESGFGSGDCFALPDLAICTPGNGMK